MVSIMQCFPAVGMGRYTGHYVAIIFATCVVALLSFVIVGLRRGVADRRFRASTKTVDVSMPTHDLDAR